MKKKKKKNLNSSWIDLLHLRDSRKFKMKYHTWFETDSHYIVIVALCEPKVICPLL